MGNHSNKLTHTHTHIHTHVHNSLLDSVGEGEGGMIWENGIETCIISLKKKKKISLVVFKAATEIQKSKVILNK